jgi:translation initiation factor IF-1
VLWKAPFVNLDDANAINRQPLTTKQLPKPQNRRQSFLRRFGFERCASRDETRKRNAFEFLKWFQPARGTSEHPAERPFRRQFIMAQEQAIEVEGKITSVLAGTMFHVELANKHTVLAHISGKMRKRFIRLTNGDRVKMEMSPYDLSKARIVYRLG